MKYKIAVATSDKLNVDTSFGETDRFVIYEIENKAVNSVEERIWTEETTQEITGCDDGNGKKCGLSETANKKIELVSDCRGILCSKFGAKIQKAFERKAIAVLEFNGTIDKALEKIIQYYDRIDTHREKIHSQEI